MTSFGEAPSRWLPSPRLRQGHKSQRSKVAPPTWDVGSPQKGLPPSLYKYTSQLAFAYTLGGEGLLGVGTPPLGAAPLSVSPEAQCFNHTDWSGPDPGEVNSKASW